MSWWRIRWWHPSRKFRRLRKDWSVFFIRNWSLSENTLLQEENGAVPKSDHAYFFRTWPELNNARLQMKETHAWAYTPSEQYLRYINQAPQPLKIKCFVIHSMTKNDANIFEYPFFEFWVRSV
jgi:hypothetical protein